MARQRPRFLSHRAVRLLRSAELGPAYEEAFATWEQTGAAGEWKITAGDGLRPDALSEIEGRPADG
jgi:hypothetical protein